MNGELENRVDEILLSIDREFTIVDLVKILSSDELAIVFDKIDFLRNINVIGTRQTEKSLVYFVVQ